MQIDYQTTANFWDKTHFDPVFLRREWKFHPTAKSRLHALLGASSREQWFHNRYLSGRSGLRGLSIGVGKAEAELNLISLGGFDRYDLYDVSPVATETGRQTAQARGLKAANFVCGDIYEAVLPDGGYDVITFFAALHHMGDLEAILQKCNRMLAPGGVLWAAEYVGPDRFQFPDKHTAFAKALYRALDPEIKLPFEPELRFPSAEEVIAADPTESIHPSEIQSTMRSIWPNMEFIGTYGTLMFILSWCLNYNAWYDTDQGRESFNTILDIDAAMIDAGRLPHYFAYLVAKKE
jgi:SAM-dependent methyltransferase